MPAFVIAALDDVEGHGDRIFWTGNGLAESAVADWQRSLRKLFKQAKVEGGHAHRFRDTFAVELLNEAVELADVSIVLGHVDQDHRTPLRTMGAFAARAVGGNRRAHVQRGAGV